MQCHYLQPNSRAMTATNQSWKSSIWVFLQFWNSSVVQILQLCIVFTLSVIVLHWLYIYLSFYVLYNIHLLLILQVFFLLSECDWTLILLYAKLNPVYSQILHVRSIWNSFKIFTVSLSAEEIANVTLTPILSKFSVLPLKPFRIPWYTYPLTHNLTRSPPLSTWVTHVKRMRRVRGTFVQFLRANSFSPWL